MRNWLSKQPDSSREILTELCRRYIQTTIDFLVNEKIIRTDSEMQKTVVGYYHTHGQMQHAVSLSNLQIVKNLFSIYEVCIASFNWNLKAVLQIGSLYQVSCT